MPATASADLIAELDAAVHNRSPARRTELLRRITKLLLFDADRLNEIQIGLFDDVLVRLIRSVEAGTLGQLSNSLSQLNIAPREAVRQLGFHEDVLVAGPVLRKSRRLSEEDLIEIVGTRGQQHLLAISGRQTLSEPLSDMLVERGDSAVHNTLARNLGAQFSEAGYAVLVGRAERDQGLAEGLEHRSDVPPGLRQKLLAKLDQLRMGSLLSRPPAMQQTIRTAIAKRTNLAPQSSTDYSEAQGKMIELSRKGRLNDSTVNRFAVTREYTEVVAALSLLSGAPIEVVEPLIASDQLDGLIAVCKAARLNWSTTIMIIRNRPSCSPVSSLELEQGQEAFEALTLSLAQRTIRL